MIKERITFLLVIFQTLFVEIKTGPRNNALFAKVIDCSRLLDDQALHKSTNVEQIGSIIGKIDRKYKCLTPNVSIWRRRVGRSKTGFTDQGTDNSKKNAQMEAPAGKYSVLNLLTSEYDIDDDDEDDDDDDDDDDDNDNDGDSGSNSYVKIKNKQKEMEEDEEKEEEEDVGEYGGINFFGEDDDEEEEIEENLSLNKDKDGHLKQYHRPHIRMHNLVFPLLLAYKLKFFTVIPLLLGSLVLLVGTTGVAGFFFALFSAALGIHAKSNKH